MQIYVKLHDITNCYLVFRTQRLTKPDYYTIQSLIFFLKHFTSVDSYETYLNAAIDEGIEFVRFQDAEQLWLFFTGMLRPTYCTLDQF